MSNGNEGYWFEPQDFDWRKLLDDLGDSEASCLELNLIDFQENKNKILDMADGIDDEKRYVNGNDDNHSDYKNFDPIAYDEMMQNWGDLAA